MKTNYLFKEYFPIERSWTPPLNLADFCDLIHQKNVVEVTFCDF